MMPDLSISHLQIYMLTVNEVRSYVTDVSYNDHIVAISHNLCICTLPIVHLIKVAIPCQVYFQTHLHQKSSFLHHTPAHNHTLSMIFFMHDDDRT